MSNTAIYEPLPEGAKPVAWWWSILQIILMFLISAVVAAIFAMVPIFVAMANGTWDPTVNPEPPARVLTYVTLFFMFPLFIMLTICSLVKIKMEKRSLHSAGLNGFLYGPRFWGGFIGGIAFAVLVSLPAVVVGAGPGIETESVPFVLDNVLTGPMAIAAIVLIVFLLIQAPAEEIFARGWLMSALGWRHGIVTAVIFSSLVFMLLHGDRAVMGLGWLVYTFGAVGSIGVLLAAIGYSMRSVIPAAGLHTGYNFTLIGGMLVYMTGQYGDPMTGFEEMQAAIANTPPLEITTAVIVDFAARTLIPLAIAFWLFNRKRKPAGHSHTVPAGDNTVVA